MSNRTPEDPGVQMDPTTFHDLMRTSFGDEPPQADFESDLAAGKRQLRRRRIGQGAVAFVTAAVVGAAALAVPAIGWDDQQTLAPASGGEQMTDQEIVDSCLGMFLLGGEMLDNSDQLSESELQRGLVALMAAPELMTSARTADGMVATLRSGDGDYWTDCTLRDVDTATDHGYASVYPTGVRFPSEVVDGRRVYEPINLADTRLEGTATASQPQVWVPCETTAPEETQEWRDELAACDRFTVVWNDRRPADVAKAKIVTPDGAASWADVRDGYLSFGYTAPMVPFVADMLRSGGDPLARVEVTFYDEAGQVLVHDANVGETPAEGEIKIANYPSLSWWLR
jgi:hypothetical protein